MNPPVPPPGRRVVVATDYDRTLTDSKLAVPPESVARVYALRKQGAYVILATGRRENAIAPPVRRAFDGLVVEGGAAWRVKDRRLHVPAPSEVWAAADSLEEAGFPIERGVASFSTTADACNQPTWQEDVNVQHNGDRVDVTPIGVDKATGVDACISLASLRDAWLLAVGDSANDLPLFARADASVAVANAVPELAARATVVAPLARYRGFLWATKGLLSGRP